MAHCGGYLAFGKIAGDHRGLWINLPQADLIGFHQHEIIPPLSRHLQLDDPHTVIRFNTVLNHNFLKYNIYSCIIAINKLAVYPLQSHHAK